MEDTQDGGWSIWAIMDYRWDAPFINKSWIMHMENTCRIVQLCNSWPNFLIFLKVLVKHRAIVSDCHLVYCSVSLTDVSSSKVVK